MSRTYVVTLPFIAVLVAAILAMVYACSQVSFASNEDLAISVTTETSEVDFGKAFALTVVRTWGKNLDPSGFPERSLTPLVTRLESTTLREHSTHWEETRRYLAYAFSPDEMVLPSISFEATYGILHDYATTAVSQPLHLRVRAALDPKSPGVPEGPGPMQPVRRRWLAWTIGAAVALFLALVAWRRSHRAGSRTPVPSPIPVGPGPDVEALARLASLRAGAGAGADIVEASDVVRAYVARRFGVRALEMTSNELLTALAQPGTSLRAVLEPSDLVKFAEFIPTAEDRVRALDAAEAYILSTRTMP